MKITLPDEVVCIIDTLNNNGYEAYAVGGCVRDAVLGRAPEDWDICTSALPEQAKRSFAGHHIIETGLKHGTITLMLNRQPFEITTYRVDGLYSDSRHPDTVEFVGDLKRDLSRRDFTINAMAYSPDKGLVDYFGGEQDIERRVIRTVGDADRRFYEDALRIMRALRFASVLGFSIDPSTSAALFESKGLLQNIAVERIVSELNRLLLGNDVERVLLGYPAILEEVIPEIGDMVGFDQRNPYHCLDVWAHTARSVCKAPFSLSIRLTLLLHDVAKPVCYTERDSIGHFYGHPKVGSDMARQILKRLKYDKNTIDAVAQMILYHDSYIPPQQKGVKRWLNRLGEERLRQLIEVKRADGKAHSEKNRDERLRALDEALSILDEVLEEGQCFSRKDLAVDGRDLLAAGVPEGGEVGAMLNQLVDMVIDGSVENEREPLLEAVESLLAKRPWPDS